MKKEMHTIAEAVALVIVLRAKVSVEVIQGIESYAGREGKVNP